MKTLLAIFALIICGTVDACPRLRICVQPPTPCYVAAPIYGPFGPVVIYPSPYYSYPVYPMMYYRPARPQIGLHFHW